MRRDLPRATRASARVLAGLLIALLSPLGVACGSCERPIVATVGEPFDLSHLDDLQPKVTTREQILAWWGEPHQVSQPLPHEPCQERWHYSTARATAGGHTEATIVVLGFDERTLCTVDIYRQHPPAH